MKSADSDSVGLEQHQGFCISDKLSGDAAAPWTTESGSA